MHPRFLQVLQGFWGQCWQKAGTLTLPNEPNITAIFLNSHAPPPKARYPLGRSTVTVVKP
jgi:hypothetical protein